METLLTCWPPGPLDRENTSSNSSGRTPRSRIRPADSGYEVSTLEFKSDLLKVKVLRLKSGGWRSVAGPKVSLPEL